MRLKKLVVVISLLIHIFYPTKAIVYSHSKAAMSVHFIDVGQGDSIFIKTPTNKHILIDGGHLTAGEKVVNYLHQQNVQTIDLLIATHPHIDHIGGLIDVIDAFTIDQIVDSGQIHVTKTFAQYMGRILRDSIPLSIVQRGDIISIDPFLTIEVLNSYNVGESINNSSIVLKITYDQLTLLFMSDLEEAKEKSLLEDHLLDAHIIKVAHHGSQTSSTKSFIEQVNPQVAILTYGKDNRFGHPTSRVIKNYAAIDALIYSTAVFGDIVIETSGKDYFVMPKKSPLDTFKTSSE